VLDGVNLDVPEGEFYALMGPNGSGKTTLASIIAAVKTQDSGIVEVYGNKPAQAKDFIGYVPQENFSSPKLSGKENLVYFANLMGYSRNQANRLVAEVLMVQEIMDKKTSIILITHIGSDAELASRVGLIDNGKMIAEGAPDELKRKHADEDVITVETAVKTDSVFSVLKGYSINGKVAESETGYKIYSQNGDRVLADVVRSLDQAGHKVMRIEMARPTLEDVFFRLTARHLQEATG